MNLHDFFALSTSAEDRSRYYYRMGDSARADRELLTCEIYLRAALRANRVRIEAGWFKSTSGWRAPDGTPEDEWLTEGLPLPEDPGYADWSSAYYHYERLDNEDACHVHVPPQEI